MANTTLDRNQLVNDTETAIRYGLDSLQSRMWTAMPAVVQSVNPDQMTVSAQIAIQGIVSNPDGTTSPVNIKPLVDCPIVFPSGGGLSMTFPIAPGDEVLMVLASRCIDSWWQNGGYANYPCELRMHDLSDGYCIPGIKSLPNVLKPTFSSTAVQIRNKAGTAYMGLDGTSSLFQMQNNSQDLGTILSNIVSLLNTLTSDLTTFSTALTPLTVAANGTALLTALGILTTQITMVSSSIGDLLE